MMIFYSIYLCVVLVMLRAWRERDQEKRIKTAHQALEHNSRYVLCRKLVFQSMVAIFSLIKFIYRLTSKMEKRESRLQLRVLSAILRGKIMHYDLYQIIVI